MPQDFELLKVGNLKAERLHKERRTWTPPSGLLGAHQAEQSPAIRIEKDSSTESASIVMKVKEILKVNASVDQSPRP